jgi:apolipoprotein D and lipocalin family protein
VCVIQSALRTYSVWGANKGFRILLKTLIVAAVGALLLSGCASMPSVNKRPQTAEIPMSHYSGTWLEIARRPMWLTNGCVAGYTTYSASDKPGEISVEDGCHKGMPAGKLKRIRARGVLTDAGGANARLEAHYPLFITWRYWVLYEAPDHSWFISADPKMKNLWIYSRTVPSAGARAVMVAKAQDLGYDVNRLEYPAF